MKGNNREDGLVGTITCGLYLGRSEALRCLRHYLRAQSQGHHTVGRMKERGVERGSARRSDLNERERTIVNQTNTGTVFKGNVGKTPERERVERIWAFRSALMLS